MLEPRLKLLVLKTSSNSTTFWKKLLLAIILLFIIVPSHGLDLQADDQYMVEPTPTLGTIHKELTTVLLLTNNGNHAGDSFGRFLSVRPEVGLLKSTARTFIQEGITTEYATQVVGTTLENGRLYAQYLKKSSRVLYENDHPANSAITRLVGENLHFRTKSSIQSHNDLSLAEAPDWQDIDDRLNSEPNEFVRNTDFVKLSEMDSKYKVISNAENSQKYMDITLNANKLLASNDPKLFNFMETDSSRKVLPTNTLLTYTVKNEMKLNDYMSNFDSKDMHYEKFTLSSHNNLNTKFWRFPKNRREHVEENHMTRKDARKIDNSLLKQICLTTTYYGFADFTTTVGDSVIVFSPKSSQIKFNTDHVTSILGEATLITFLDSSSDEERFMTKTIDKYVEQYSTETKILNEDDFIDRMLDNKDSLSKNQNTAESVLESNDHRKFNEDETNVPMLSLPTDKEISEIYASISQLEASEKFSDISKTKKLSTIERISEKIIRTDHKTLIYPSESLKMESRLQNIDGATTIFFEDDTFPDFLSTTVAVELESNNKMMSEESNDLSAESKTIHTEIRSNVFQSSKRHCNRSLDSFEKNISIEINELNYKNCFNSLNMPNKNLESSLLAKEVSILSKTTQFTHRKINISTSTRDFSTLMNEIETRTEDSSFVETTISEREEDFNEDSDYEHEHFATTSVADSGENIELIYKTFYTTYTYLTTFFQEFSSTVTSHTEVVTNVITSSLNNLQSTTASKKGFVPSISTLRLADITKTSKYTLPNEIENYLKIQNNNIEIILDNSLERTAFLDDSKYTKTYFTTYTYYTTIFSENDTEIMSHSEILTNFITNSKNIVKPIMSENKNSTKIIKKLDTSYNVVTTLIPGQTIDGTKPFRVSDLESSPSNENDISNFISSVLTSSSRSKIPLKNIIQEKIDDQINSESNTDEIIPSATIVLQTSLTTYTYYTTMYLGNNSNIISRLETVTNVATETVEPTKFKNNLDVSFPITYFTTFTYWTKLAKDGEITTITRQETISSIVQPTSTEPFLERTSSQLDNALIYNDKQVDILSKDKQIIAYQSNSTITHVTSETLPNIFEPTTYFTTFTYYTTFYEPDKTFIDSRFETLTSVIVPTGTFGDRNFEAQTVIAPNGDNKSKTLINFAPFDNLILYDYKKIVDADGVSTLHFTTHVTSSLNEDGFITEVTSSTSSFHINDSKKSFPDATNQLNSSNDNSTKQYKTGLVRLIEGTRIGNSTTTLYQSKVIGTVINNRYAQIIQSTSSFLFEKSFTSAIRGNLSDFHNDEENYSESTDSSPLNFNSTISNPLVQSSISDPMQQTEKEDNQFIELQQNADQNFYSQTKSRKFAPVIRPFASRNRPIFAPKQKYFSPSSATIITRSDITPTITATPALKSVGRYSSVRRGGSINANGKKIIRPVNASAGPQSTFRTLTSRNRLSAPRGSSIISTNQRQLGSSIRSTTLLGHRTLIGSSNLFNTLNRIKTTRTHLSNLISSSILHKSSSSIEEDNLTQYSKSEEGETSTDYFKRNQNNFLKLKRPVLRPSGAALSGSKYFTNNNISTVSLKRNPLSSRGNLLTALNTNSSIPTSTTRPSPKAFQRPLISSANLRSKIQNSLFPPRISPETQKSRFKSNLNGNEKRLNKEEDYDSNSEHEEDDINDYEEDDDDGDDNNSYAKHNENDGVRSKRSNTLVESQDAYTLPHFRRRRNTNFTSQSNRSKFRFRRPKTVTTEAPIDTKKMSSELLPSPSTSSRTRALSRLGSRYQNTYASSKFSSIDSISNIKSIRPTKPVTNRTQFTLREKDLSTLTKLARPHPNVVTNTRRQSISSPSLRRRPSTSISSKSRMMKSNNIVTDNSPRNIGSTRSRTNVNSSSRNRSTGRSRNRNQTVSEQSNLNITITYVMPVEVTVPLVNGQVTEFKNIVTGKTINEVIAPSQYTNTIGIDGQTSLLLLRKDSNINSAGATEITQYLLHDSVTTTVTFTPTTIRGRKTSFSHVLPSTVYSVENIVSTIQPKIAANAPLANILLSQLLLGNIGLPTNPLLGGVGLTNSAPGITASQSAMPMTEYRTHTSIYITTIFDGKSTVLPVTFQGKKILTTVYDTTAQTITATEYITDTILTTPTQQLQQLQQQPTIADQLAQVNSLLLQQLLLQQQSQFELPINPTVVPNINLSDSLQDLDLSHTNLKYGNNIDDLEDIGKGIEETNIQTKGGRSKHNKSGKNQKHRKNPNDNQKFEESTTVITLYVSGRRPGEFSTILSTLQNNEFEDHTASLHKRHADINHILHSIEYDTLENYYDFVGSEINKKHILPGYSQNKNSRKINSHRDFTFTPFLQNNYQINKNVIEMENIDQIYPTISSMSTNLPQLLNRKSNRK